MKKIITLLALCISVSALAQTSVKKVVKSPVNKTSEPKAEKTVLARLIKTRVMIKDTITIQGLLNRSGDLTTPISEHIADTYINYLEPSYFNEFKQNIYQLANSKTALIYGWGSQPMSPSRIRETYTLCDSIDEFSLDQTGNEIVVKSFRCDSTSRIENVNAINFYETWTYNESNKMIEKEVLAYDILSYNNDKEAFIILFTIVKDEEARKKTIKLY